MKFARLRMRYNPDAVHPMHAFEMEHDRIDYVELLHWNLAFEETNTFVFRVRWDPAPFRAKLESRDATLSYSLTSEAQGEFYCVVRDRVTDVDKGVIEALARGTIVVRPPVRFNPDGTTDLTVVGAPEDVDEAIDALPDGIAATVQSVGPYRRWGGQDPQLTERQRSAVAVAVEHGYYDSPRQGSVSAVAAELDIAPGTAAEHLRKAESRIMRQVHPSGDPVSEPSSQ